MPKERIGQKHDDSNPEPIIEVRWGKESSYVQIATIMPDDDIPLKHGPEANGWYYSPSREQINQLIRSLRRARDQAYGKDA